jgi:hypothetical protein
MSLETIATILELILLLWIAFVCTNIAQNVHWWVRT